MTKKKYFICICIEYKPTISRFDCHKLDATYYREFKKNFIIIIKKKSIGFTHILPALDVEEVSKSPFLPKQKPKITIMENSLPPIGGFFVYLHWNFFFIEKKAKYNYKKKTKIYRFFWFYSKKYYPQNRWLTQYTRVLRCGSRFYWWTSDASFLSSKLFTQSIRKGERKSPRLTPSIDFPISRLYQRYVLFRKRKVKINFFLFANQKYIEHIRKSLKTPVYSFLIMKNNLTIIHIIWQ